MPIKHDENRVIKPQQTRYLTAEHLVEIAKCKKDIKYFAQKYYK
jgi:hypothetical protein